MSNYSFSTLNDKEFEQIVKDLLNAKLNIGLQNFKSGKDAGIDLRFSSSKNNNSIVVQAKHYIGSQFPQLKHILLVKELGKIKKIKPDRYIVATSLPLSALQKDELKTGLSPFVLTSNDIIGQEDLNGYLSEFKEVEKRYFKLWFSSINVFNAIINNAIEGRTRYLLERISDKIKFYVITKKLDYANKILKNEKLLLITGQPGIGKTTLAEIILFEWAKNGCKVYKVEDVREAEDVMSANNDERQLFYFDDFLGANYSEIINIHKTETQLTNFVDRVKNTTNKYLVLTTRTVILNHAIDKYEKVNNSKIAYQQFELKLTDYSKLEKALILYNHLYFRGINKELHNVFLENKFYKAIIQHKNYTPRIIDFITEVSRIEKLSVSTYHQFIINNLNNPKEIWRYSFNNQIGYLDRCLLMTLFTFEGGSFEPALSLAFENRLYYERDEHNQIIYTNQFSESLKILLNGFIISVIRDAKQMIRMFQFINPSLTDFLIGHISDSYLERKSIISSLTFVEQLNRFDPEKSLVPLEKELQLIIRDRISNDKIIILQNDNTPFADENKCSVIIETLCRYCNQVNIDGLLLEKFVKLNRKVSSWASFQRMEYVLTQLNDVPQTHAYVKENFIEIIEAMMVHISGLSSAEKVPFLFDKYGHNYKEYTESADGFGSLIDVIENVLRNEEDDLKRNRQGEIQDFDEVVGLYDQISLLERELKDVLFPDDSIEHDFGIDIDRYYWDDVINDNILESKKADLMDDYEDHYREEQFERSQEDKAIDDLFIVPE